MEWNVQQRLNVCIGHLYATECMYLIKPPSGSEMHLRALTLHHTTKTLYLLLKPPHSSGKVHDLLLIPINIIQRFDIDGGNGAEQRQDYLLGHKFIVDKVVPDSFQYCLGTLLA